MALILTGRSTVFIDGSDRNDIALRPYLREWDCLAMVSPSVVRIK